MKGRENEDGGSAQALPLRQQVVLHRAIANGSASVVGIAADHGGFQLKQYLIENLRKADCQVLDFGSRSLDPNDDYPDFVVPLARAVARGEVSRGIAVCGSGVGACVAANKVAGVRAGLLHDTFSAHQGVEDDDVNVICLGGLVVGHALAWELLQTFLAARFTGADRHRRRLAKLAELEECASGQPFSRGSVKALGARLLARMQRGS